MIEDQNLVDIDKSDEAPKSMQNQFKKYQSDCQLPRKHRIEYNHGAGEC